MKVYIRGKVIGSGDAPTKEAGGRIHWLKLYQDNGTERPGETADIWSPEPLPVVQGQEVLLEAAVRVDDNGRLKIQRARVVESEELAGVVRGLGTRSVGAVKA